MWVGKHAFYAEIYQSYNSLWNSKEEHNFGMYRFEFVSVNLNVTMKNIYF